VTADDDDKVAQKK